MQAGYVQLVSSTVGAADYLVTGLNAGTTYYFKVKAKNEVGSSSLSTGQGFIAGSIPSPPLFLTLLTQNRFMIQFQWTAPSSNGGVSLTAYKIYWDSGSGSADLSSFTLEKTLSTSSSSYTKSSDLTAGVEYQFYVVAAN